MTGSYNRAMGRLWVISGVPSASQSGGYVAPLRNIPHFGGKIATDIDPTPPLNNVIVFDGVAFRPRKVMDMFHV